MSQGPHSLQQLSDRPGIMPDVLSAIGNTPLVRVNKISKSAGLKCELRKAAPPVQSYHAPPPSGQVRVLQRRRLSEGQDCLEDGRGRREGRPAEAGETRG